MPGTTKHPFGTVLIVLAACLVIIAVLEMTSMVPRVIPPWNLVMAGAVCGAAGRWFRRRPPEALPH